MGTFQSKSNNEAENKIKISKPDIAKELQIKEYYKDQYLQ